MSTSPISQEQEKVQQAMLAHVDAYLIKPFRADTLRAKLNQVLLKIYGDEARPALLADDDESVREIVRDLLKSMKFDPIFEARDGVQAYHLLEQHYEDIALVVSDWEMPKMEGIELLRRLRSNPVYAEIPFLMITSQTSIEHIKVNLAIKAEVDHYLMKPFTLEDFREKVAVVLKRGHRAKRIKRRLAEAHQLMKDGDLESARLMYSHVLNLDPRAVEAYLGLANIKRTQSSGGAFEEVVALIRDAIEIAPNWDRSYIELAHVYEAEKSLDRAIAILKEAIIPCPMSHLIHYELGRLLYKRGRGQPAIEELEKAIRIRPDHSDAGELLKLIKESK